MRKIFPVFMLVLALLPVASDAGGTKKSTKKEQIQADLKKLSGNWTMVKLTLNDANMDTTGMSILFDGDKYYAVIKGKKVDAYGKLYLDPTKEPKTFDLVFTAGAVTGTNLGIYRFTEDGLELCYNQIRGKMPTKRPTAFSAGAVVGAGDTFVMAEREAGENPKGKDEPKKGGTKVSKKDAIKADLKSLSGNWNMLKMEVNGKAFGSADGKGILFDGDTYHFVINGKKSGTSAKIFLDPTMDPKTIDLQMTGGGISGTQLGIYRLTEDGLEICVNQIRGKMANKRPTAFSSGATVGAGDTFYVLEKAK